MIYRIAWFVVSFVYGLFLRRKTYGAENVPKTGPVLIASNHLSYLDPPLVGTAVWRPAYFMAKEELFHSRLGGWFIRQLNAFPVQRGSADRASLKHSLDLLSQNKVFVMFPEGTRSETGELGEAEMGVGMIAYRSGAPVVPAYLWGTDRAMPRSGGIHLAPIGIAFGKPLHFAATEGRKPGRAEYEEAARQIMAAIAQLRDQYRPKR